MKKVKFRGDRFVEVVDGEPGEVLQCCFSKNNMSTSCLAHCVACEFVDQNDENIRTTVRCSRGDFVFATIED